ncbi:MAG: RidA family protein [Alphaproteobacteria bacterium]|nr:RidA family protein [Alphaproteobacteria bacterium]
MRRLISSGSSFEAVAGYSRAVVDGDWVWLSGTTGMNYAKGTIADDVAEQTHQTFRNIDRALAAAGSSLADVVRVFLIITKQEYFKVVAPIMGQYFGGIRPASTGIVTELVDPRIKVEIEVTAKRRV